MRNKKGNKFEKLLSEVTSAVLGINKYHTRYCRNYTDW